MVLKIENKNDKEKIFSSLVFGPKLRLRPDAFSRALAQLHSRPSDVNPLGFLPDLSMRGMGQLDW